jgi:hypothetical protein
MAVHHPRDLFDRMVGGLEFDASELSASEYITRFAAGQCPFVALPVFPSRMFRHGFIAVDSRVIREPRDLEGKRVGVQLYTMTAAIWIRGLLRHDHGVDLSAIQWVEGAMESPKPHGRPTVLPPLKPVTIVSNTSGKSLSQLLEQGDVQAVIGADLPSSFGKSPHIKRQLFPEAEGVLPPDRDLPSCTWWCCGGTASGIPSLRPACSTRSTTEGSRRRTGCGDISARCATCALAAGGLPGSGRGRRDLPMAPRRTGRRWALVVFHQSMIASRCRSMISSCRPRAGGSPTKRQMLSPGETAALAMSLGSGVPKRARRARQRGFGNRNRRQREDADRQVQCEDDTMVDDPAW